jgi:hypothetical protein
MWLLLVAPLLSQALMANAQIEQPGLPAWLNELTCSSTHNAQSPNAPLQHDLPGAKCGYCTLLLSSPALSSTAVVGLNLPPLSGAPLPASAISAPQLTAPFPAAHPRAPPLTLS